MARRDEERMCIMSVDRQRSDDHRLVSIIIPAYDEAQHIAGTIQSVSDAFLGSSWNVEIIVVDDGSHDETVLRAQRSAPNIAAALIVLRHERNQGKGAALRTGFLHSQGIVVGFIDADREYPVQALPTMAQMIDDSPHSTCVIGCRVADDRTWLERTTSRLAHRVASAVLSLPVTDTQAGLKMFPGPMVRDIVADCHQSGWLYDIELLLHAVEQQLYVVELPLRQRSVRRRRASLWSMIRCGPVLVGLAVGHRQRTLQKNRRQLREMIRFGVVGAINSGVDLGVFWLLTQLWSVGHHGFEAGAESLVAWIVASFVGYALHSRYTFHRQLPRAGFYVVTGLGVSIQVTLTALATHWFGASEAVPGKMVGIGIASMITYFGYRFLAQRSQTEISSAKVPRIVRAQVPTVVCQDS